MTRYGYTRPRFDGEDTSVDVDALDEYELSDVVVEEDFRSRGRRSELLARLKPGDVLVVSSLDRLDGRLDGVIKILAELREKRVDVRCGERSVFAGTDDPLGGLLRELLGFQTGVRSTATREGMRKGNPPGRPRALSEDEVAVAVELRRLDRSIGHIANVLGVSASAVQRALTRAEV